EPRAAAPLVSRAAEPGPARHSRNHTVSYSPQDLRGTVRDVRGPRVRGPQQPHRLIIRNSQRGSLALRKVTMFTPKDWLDRAFEVGIILKGLNGLAELLGGLLLLFATPGSIHRLAV